MCVEKHSCVNFDLAKHPSQTLLLPILCISSMFLLMIDKANATILLQRMKQ